MGWLDMALKLGMGASRTLAPSTVGLSSCPKAANRPQACSRGALNRPQDAAAPASIAGPLPAVTAILCGLASSVTGMVSVSTPAS